MFQLCQAIPALRLHFWLRLSEEAAGPGTVQIQKAGPLSVQVPLIVSNMRHELKAPRLKRWDETRLFLICCPLPFCSSSSSGTRSEQLSLWSLHLHWGHHLMDTSQTGSMTHRGGMSTLEKDILSVILVPPEQRRLLSSSELSLSLLVRSR